MRRSMHDFMAFTRGKGLSMPQFGVLMRLYHVQSCDVSGLGEHLGVSNAAASQMIDRLVQQGLLARGEQAADRRVRTITLTEAGRALVEESIAARQRWLEQLTTALTPAEQAEIAAALLTLTRAAGEP